MAYSRARDIESSENSAFMDSETSTYSKMTSKNNTFQFLKRKRAIKRKIIFSVYFSFAFLIVCVVLPLKWISMSNEFASQFGIHTSADGDFIRSQDRGSAFLHFGSERARRADSTDRNEFMNQSHSAEQLSSNSSNDVTTVVAEEECIPRAVDEFPQGPISQRDIHNGAFVLHILIALYMFLALAIVCDDFFVPSLEILCEKCHMSEDVAGATFMSAGSSAPEFFTSLIGVFVAQNDVGVGTIVGSAVFNILCIIGICALFAGKVIQLTWWPLCRDSSYYLLSVIALILVTFDEQIIWYESVVLVVLYVFYILLMTFNRYIQAAINKRFKNPVNKTAAESPVRGIALKTSDYGSPMAKYAVSQPYVISTNDKEIFQPRDFADASLRVMLSKNFKPACRMRAAARIIIAARRREAQITLVTDSTIDKLAVVAGCQQTQVNNYQIHLEKRPEDEITKDTTNEQNGQQGGVAAGGEGGDSSDQEGLCDVPSGFLGVAKWILLLPINLAFFLTVPDCREERWKRWFAVSFINSILWISVLSYLMVWMTAIVGDALQVPDTVMGVTFLAGGTSIPDCMASLLVARQGLGDMAVSNSIGSNVFDILVGLGMPWFLKTVVISWDHTIEIKSRGLKYSVVLLFISVAVTITAIGFNKWKLNRKLGVVFLLTYVAYIIVACMIELNVFGDINPPTC